MIKLRRFNKPRQKSSKGDDMTIMPIDRRTIAHRVEPQASDSVSGWIIPSNARFMGSAVGGIIAWHLLAQQTPNASNIWQEPYQALFRKLADQWHDETDMYSIGSQQIVHPAYLQIIASGKVMIPYILSDLVTRGGNWYSALETLAEMSPVGPEDTTNVRLRKAAWLRWGKTNGYLGVGYVSYAISGKLLSQFAP